MEETSMKNAPKQLVSRDSSDLGLRALQLQKTLESSGESVVIKDLDAVITFWNPQATALYGFTADEAIGHPLRDLHAADLSDEAYAAVWHGCARVKPARPPRIARKRMVKLFTF
jgi:PAS domain S-box-containing protein